MTWSGRPFQILFTSIKGGGHVQTCLLETDNSKTESWSFLLGSSSFNSSTSLGHSHTTLFMSLGLFVSLLCRSSRYSTSAQSRSTSHTTSFSSFTRTYTLALAMSLSKSWSFYSPSHTFYLLSGLPTWLEFRARLPTASSFATLDRFMS